MLLAVGFKISLEKLEEAEVSQLAAIPKSVVPEALDVPTMPCPDWPLGRILTQLARDTRQWRVFLTMDEPSLDPAATKGWIDWFDALQAMKDMLGAELQGTNT